MESKGEKAARELAEWVGSITDAIQRERNEAHLAHQCSEATLEMAVARLGGEVEGQPTERVNFLQRIDELRRIEADNEALRAKVAELEETVSDIGAEAIEANVRVGRLDQLLASEEVPAELTAAVAAEVTPDTAALAAWRWFLEALGPPQPCTGVAATYACIDPDCFAPQTTCNMGEMDHRQCPKWLAGQAPAEPQEEQRITLPLVVEDSYQVEIVEDVELPFFLPPDAEDALEDEGGAP